MRAIVYRHFGGPTALEVVDLPQPTPGKGEIRVRVHAAALNPKDLYLLKGKPLWLRLAGGSFPRPMGFDFAGEVEGTGQRVFGMLNGARGDACADWLVVPASQAVPFPEGLAFVEAAAVPLVALTALQALRDEGRVGPGHHVLVHGASGGVGSAAVQIATALGAKVTASCSGANRDLVLGLGASSVIDYTCEPVLGAGVRYDAIFDAAGKLDFAACRHALAPEGTYVSTVPGLRLGIQAALSRLGGPRARLVAVWHRRADLELVATWLAQKRLRPVVDSVFPLAQVVDAMARLATRRARGKVVVDLDT